MATGFSWGPPERSTRLARPLNQIVVGQAAVDRGGLYLHHALALLVIQRHGICSYSTLEKELGMSNASVSRTLCTLFEDSAHRKTNYGLIEISRDPREGRRYQASLTPKGQRLVSKLSAIYLI